VTRWLSGQWIFNEIIYHRSDHFAQPFTRALCGNHVIDRSAIGVVWCRTVLYGEFQREVIWFLREVMKGIPRSGVCLRCTYLDRVDVIPCTWWETSTPNKSLHILDKIADVAINCFYSYNHTTNCYIHTSDCCV